MTRPEDVDPDYRVETPITTTCADHHPDIPVGYPAWHDWAVVMQKTHRQVKCAECGTFSIWLPKEI